MTADRSVVTGGAGFLGSHLCERLLADGHEVVCLDNLGSGREANVSHLTGHDGFEFVEGDVREALVQQVPEPERVDRIYHLASRASPTDFEQYPVDIAETNGIGTHNVLRYATEFDARVVYASTSEVYGDPEVHPQDESYHGNVNVSGPRAPYDEGKRFGETLCESFNREFGTDVRTVRIFNTYGPRMRPDDGRVVPTFLAQALRGECLTVHGDGEQTRCFCYVSDMIGGIHELGRRSGLAGAVVNVGHTDEVTINRLAETVSEVLDRDVEVVNVPRPADDPSRRKPTIDRAQDLLDWVPTVDLEDGLARTADWLEDVVNDAPA